MTDPQINSPKSFMTGEFPKFLPSALEQERKSGITTIRKVSNGFIGLLHPMYRLAGWH